MTFNVFGGTLNLTLLQLWFGVHILTMQVGLEGGTRKPFKQIFVHCCNVFTSDKICPLATHFCLPPLGFLRTVYFTK